MVNLIWLIIQIQVVVLMFYFLHRDATTGLNAPLYGHENVTSEDSETNQDWSVSYW